ncbi:MAG: peptidylprolyl isomerase [Pseudolysinimonas sp.]|uniref:peptidylprolyl isomerase n=1 Tax=Pseudolysinimonas sp. TaxID=2680009 RepID=UPI0032647B6C
MASNSNQQRDSREAQRRLKVYEARQQLNATQSKRRVRDNIFAIVGVVLVAGLAGFTQFFYFTSGPGAPTPAPTATEVAADQNVGAPDPSLAEDRVWTGEVSFNDAVLGISLDGTLAPQAVAGMVQDMQAGYYPGKNCHRLAPDASFLQCGSIDGVGGPDSAFSYGPVENDPADNSYPAGTIAMARSGGDAYSEGHQFFILLTDTTLGSDAAGGYSIVGTVTSGLDALKALVASGIDPTTVASDGTGAPLNPITITGFTLQ